jgi:hypothetical protein
MKAPKTRKVSTSEPADKPDTSRRRFIIGAGIAAAPLLVTLTAKPAIAGGHSNNGSLGNYGSKKKH